MMMNSTCFIMDVFYPVDAIMTIEVGLNPYSERKDSIGFAVAALYALKLIENNAMNSVMAPAKKKIHQAIPVLYAN